MSTETPNRQTTSDDMDLEAFVEEYREKIEREANSDRTASWVCERLLNWYERRDQS